MRGAQRDTTCQTKNIHHFVTLILGSVEFVIPLLTPLSLLSFGLSLISISLLLLERSTHATIRDGIIQTNLCHTTN